MTVISVLTLSVTTDVFRSLSRDLSYMHEMNFTCVHWHDAVSLINLATSERALTTINMHVGNNPNRCYTFAHVCIPVVENVDAHAIVCMSLLP